MKRILTAALLILVVVLLIFRGQPWMLTLASALIAELAAYEYLRLANARRRAHSCLVDAPWHGGGLPLHPAQLPQRGGASRAERAGPVSAGLDGLPRAARPRAAGRGARPLRAGLCGVSADPDPDDLEPRRRQAAAALPDGLRLGGRHRRVLRWPPLGPAQALAAEPQQDLGGIAGLGRRQRPGGAGRGLRRRDCSRRTSATPCCTFWSRCGSRPCWR